MKARKRTTTVLVELVERVELVGATREEIPSKGSAPGRVSRAAS